jgi:hypothetical protein
MAENETETMDVINYDINDAWDNYLNVGNINNMNVCKKLDNNIPKGTELYISTKTKICYLSHPIDLYSIFWDIPIIEYHTPKEGIIKKQMKFNFTNDDALLKIQEKLKDLKNVNQHIITQIINPEGRIKFKDIRKITIGISNKDIIRYRSKEKSAFYNCFVLIMRIKENNIFKEIHVKVFNTGKLEIPGIREDKLLDKIMKNLIIYLKPYTINKNITYDINKCETVLINSNFNCGFYINRDILYDILKYKYKINCIFDSCQYPGIQCKYLYNSDDQENDYTYKISFMIFRTGSVLIVGKCDDNILNIVYNFIKDLLIEEYPNIYVQNTKSTKNILKNKKIIKRTITIE